MTAMRNAVHGVSLGIWATLGLIFTLGCLFGASPASVPPLMFWGWFAAFAAITTAIVTKLKGPVGALATHGGALLVLAMIPRVFPLSLLRLGLDLLAGR